IVKSLRNFSRLDEAQAKEVDIHEGIESTLVILQNRLKANAERPDIQIIKEYGNLPLVDCYPSQLNQVFMNILSNAIDSLESRFANDALEESFLNCDLSTPKNNQNNLTIRICTENISSDRISIRIADNGIGITEKVRQQIFNPFFTTKPVGKGTGLGLSISYQIVTETHHGQLLCHSEPGQGTEFIVEIPIHQQISETIKKPYYMQVTETIENPYYIQSEIKNTLKSKLSYVDFP
ncbi:MAG TPA: ATP-binding protein, partial [Phormidium sp.]